MNNEEKIRKLAQSNYYQNLYQASKESSGIQLFENTCNFSNLQIRFLYWLSTYSMLFEELIKHEEDCLTANVILDNDRTDAYLLYRNKKHDYLWKKYRRDEKLAEIRSRQPNKHKSDNAQLIEVDLNRKE